MLNGTDLGRAIGAAIDAKIASGAIRSKADVAKHFNVRTPSIYDWIKKGSISKDKLPELWRYFADVVGPTHWGLEGWPDMGSPMPEQQRSAKVVERAPDWPFPSIPENKVRGLGEADLRRLEGAIALAIAQLNLKMDVAPASAAPKANPQPIVLPVEQAANDPGYVAIPLKKIKIRAGVAGFSLDQTGNGTAGAIYVSREWLQRKGFVAEKLFATRVGGLSMWPRVDEGDLVLINTADTDRRNGYVYGFNHEGQFVLKRLKKQLNRWYLTSDNPDKTQFPPIHADEGTFMIGRAVLLQAEEI
ncbi:S24 family peptidase [Pigmentiphaga daeguensis]|uniref:Peptidase S24/S26A/S26B/S26C domain-containing protein n=1 Tax=Pigmentiphaga daeguensis TaxID=414049 RepID=A0ABP3L750_9BURK